MTIVKIALTEISCTLGSLKFCKYLFLVGYCGLLPLLLWVIEEYAGEKKAKVGCLMTVAGRALSLVDLLRCW